SRPRGLTSSSSSWPRWSAPGRRTWTRWPRSTPPTACRLIWPAPPRSPPSTAWLLRRAWPSVGPQGERAEGLASLPRPPVGAIGRRRLDESPEVGGPHPTRTQSYRSSGSGRSSDSEILLNLTDFWLGWLR